MKNYFLLLSASLLLTACATGPEKTLPASVDAPEPASSFFTNVKGPSKESGDCGGYAFWLHEQNGRFSSGKAAEFEGGCGIYPREIVEIQHDPKTRKIKIWAVSNDPRQFVQFQGQISKLEMVGVISHVDKETKKPVSGVVNRRGERFKLTDYADFRRRLPPN